MSPSTDRDDEKVVVPFHQSEATAYHPPAQEQWADLAPEERKLRIRALVEQRARQPEFETIIYLEDDAQHLHIEPGKFKALIKAQRQANEKQRKEREKEREKNFKKIAKLPRREADKRLADMAERDGVDVEELSS